MLGKYQTLLYISNGDIVHLFKLQNFAFKLESFSLSFSLIFKWDFYRVIPNHFHSNHHILWTFVKSTLTASSVLSWNTQCLLSILPSYPTKAATDQFSSLSFLNSISTKPWVIALFWLTVLPSSILKKKKKTDRQKERAEV